MIDGHCFANLDGFKLVEWPDTFAAVPRIGERVEGRRGGEFPTLRVVGVTHTIVNGAPFIRVELHR